MSRSPVSITGGRVGARGRTGVAGVLLAMALVGGSVAARAGDEYRGTAEQEAACTSDVFRLCWDEVPNVSKIVACLKRERPRLSTECRAVFQQQPTYASRSRTGRSRHYYHHHQAKAD